MSYPQPFPGRTDTSADAARKVARNVTVLEAQVLEHIRSKGPVGATADECSKPTGIWFQTCRARCTDLKSRGLLVDSKQRRKSPVTGNTQIVWVAT